MNFLKKIKDFIHIVYILDPHQQIIKYSLFTYNFTTLGVSCNNFNRIE